MCACATRAAIHADAAPPPAQRAFRWRVRSTTGFTEPGVWLEVQHQGTVQQVVWHLKGDYLGVVLSGVRAAVALHHVSKRQSRRSFRKNANLAQAISFHPTKPWFLVATQRHVRVYDLLEQKQVKRLVSGMKWISSLAVHPSGDHVVAGRWAGGRRRRGCCSRRPWLTCSSPQLRSARVLV